ncbi:DUF6931 family protein [Pseudoalteromonas denitrificans]|uniref:Uncharacterized protein n=1 Tax=Pseudoalteromonas denitrificans DSM 6059 TaxID=1123010 RepID=A0A1I1N3L1_9GAMM|nr:hypothetical protein [Pseudoalteromonas denitrificans]SFC90068.1 hypothetical protein SAMN02745724_02863 [Pseudoalteromonas denitrificans DSM 6059]
MYKKIPNTSVASILSRYELSEDAQNCTNPDMTPALAIESLQTAKLYNDVIQFIAHALPMVDAINWASIVLEIREKEWSETQVHAINSARNWLKQPNETYRIRANQLADRVGLETAPAWVAKAVYWSGTGSIVAPELPAVMPPAFLYGHAVAAAITVAAAVPLWQKEDMGYEKFYIKAIQLGLEIANGQAVTTTLLSIKEEA